MTTSPSRMAPIFLRRFYSFVTTAILEFKNCAGSIAGCVKGDQRLNRLEKKLQELNVEEQSEDDEEDEDMEESD